MTKKSNSHIQANWRIMYKKANTTMLSCPLYGRGKSDNIFSRGATATSQTPCCTHSSQTQWSCRCRNWRQHSFHWLPLHRQCGWDCPALLSLHLLVHLQIQKVRDVLRGSGKYGVSECITKFNCLTNYNQYCITLYWMNNLANLFRLLQCGEMQHL